MGYALRNYDVWKTTLPVVADDSQAQVAWLESAAEQLVQGSDVVWKRRNGPQRRVTADEFAAVVQNHLNDRQKDGLDEQDGFGRLVINAMAGAPGKTHAQYLLGPTRHPLGKLHELAENLLREFAPDAAAAQREEDEDGAV